MLPTITKLFASQDRAIRVGLLQNFDAFGPHVSASVMDEQVFPQIATGFADSSPFTRELTLKSMLTIVPKVRGGSEVTLRLSERQTTVCPVALCRPQF